MGKKKLTQALLLTRHTFQPAPGLALLMHQNPDNDIRAEKTTQQTS